MKTKRQVPNTKTMMIATVVSAVGALLAFLDPGQGIELLDLRLCLRGAAQCLSIHYGDLVPDSGHPANEAQPSKLGTYRDTFGESRTQCRAL